MAQKSSSRSIARPRAFEDSDDDDAGHQASSSRREEIVSFGREGAKGRRASPVAAAPRVIPVASNLDWRQERKQRLGMASNLQSLGPLVSMRRADSTAVSGSATTTSANGDADTDAINTEAQKAGLEVRKSRPRSEDAPPDSLNQATDATASIAADAATTSDEKGTDQEALKALLAGEGIGSSRDGEPLIIQQQESESELLQHDIDSRPEAPTLDDYAATPIDQFGMALLRGMGWKEGMGAGKGGKGPQQAAEPKKRAALLGLGAKERPSASAGSPMSLNSSSRNHRPKDRRDYKYVPITKRESETLSNGSSEPSAHRSRGVTSSRDYPHREEKDRYIERQRSRSPPRSKDSDRHRHRDSRRDDRDSHSRSHGSSRSDHDRRSDDRDRHRDRDRDRHRDDRRHREHRR